MTRPATTGQRRLRRARRDLGVSLMVAAVVLALAVPAWDWLFAATVLVAFLNVAFAFTRVRRAGRVQAAAPARAPLDRGWIRAFELEVWGEVFHCFGHRYLVVLREGTCPLCGGHGESQAELDDGARRDLHVRDEASRALDYADQVGPADPREACRLIREALASIVDSREEADADLADDLIAAYGRWDQAIHRAPTVTAVAGELGKALSKALALEAGGHMTLADALAAHARVCAARRKLLARRGEWKWPHYAEEALTKAAATVAARFADRIRAAGPAAIEVPAMGGPPGCSEFVPGKPGGDTVMLFAAPTVGPFASMPSGGAAPADPQTGQVVVPDAEDLVPYAWTCVRLPGPPDPHVPLPEPPGSFRMS